MYAPIFTAEILSRHMEPQQTVIGVFIHLGYSNPKHTKMRAVTACALLGTNGMSDDFARNPPCPPLPSTDPVVPDQLLWKRAEHILLVLLLFHTHVVDEQRQSV